MTQVVIVGAGLMGRLLAWRLSKSGVKVSVYDASQQDASLSAAWTAAAMIAPISEKPLCHPDVFQFGLRSLQLWPQLLAELQRDTGQSVRYLRRGTLVVAHPSDAAELTLFKNKVCDAELPGESYAVALDQEGIAKKEPQLSTSFDRGFWLPDEAQVDNRSLLSALSAAAEQYGAEFHYSAPVQFDGDRHLYRRGDSELTADIVIDCRGAGMVSRAHYPEQYPEQHPEKDRSTQSIEGIRGIRGETIWVACPEIEIHRPVRLLHPRYHLYLVPRGEGKYQLGATELETNDRSPVSVRSAMEMLSAFWALAPEFSEARILSMETNLRPATQDHRPVIIDDIHDNGRIVVNGLFRHGFLLAPALLEKLTLGALSGLMSLPKRSSTGPRRVYETGY